jgi:hypothetical protein
MACQGYNFLAQATTCSGLRVCINNTGNKSKLALSDKILVFHSIKTWTSASNFNLSYLQDVVTLKLILDPQPHRLPQASFSLGAYDVSGCKEYSKLKRIMSWLLKLRKTDRFIYSLQETHVSSKEYVLINSL